ncbi:MAG TPA: hypothetical protein DEB09_01575 [Candidatus Magasanikbacteria bacterium]|nr:hypothetical protein [Candidatus Magasanikbacteria bacterium]
MNSNRGLKIERGVTIVDNDINERLNRMTDHLSGEDIEVHLEQAKSADGIIDSLLNTDIESESDEPILSRTPNK